MQGQNSSYYSEAKVFVRPNGGRVKIMAEVLEKVFPWLKYTPETPVAGGVLLGRRIVDSENIVIDDLSLPQSGDICTPNYNEWKAETHNKVIQEAWEKSGGSCHWLGNWHTHCETVPTQPHNVDLQDWNNALVEGVMEFDELFFVIFGTEGLKIYEGNQKDCSIYELKPVVMDAQS